MTDITLVRKRKHQRQASLYDIPPLCSTATVQSHCGWSGAQTKPASMPVRLFVRRPSPTTVSFTVSNARNSSGPYARLLFLLQTFLRVLSFACVLLACSAKLRHVLFAENGPVARWRDLWSSQIGSLTCRVVDSCNLGFLLMVSAVVIYAVLRKECTGLWPNMI